MNYKYNPVGVVCLDDETSGNLYGDIFLDYKKVPPSLKLQEKQDFPSESLPEFPNLPYGENIVEYFEEVTKRYWEKHRIKQKTDILLGIKPCEIEILVKNMDTLLSGARAGIWTKMDSFGHLFELDYPDCDSFIFDTETFVKGSKCNSPIVGQAIGRDYYGNVCFYLWLHPDFDVVSDKTSYKPTRISIGEDKLFVGHNSSFDFQKINERYSYKKKNIIALCTMSMMMLVAGVDDSQRWALNVKDKKHLSNYKVKAIREFGCKMSLVSCYEFMTGKTLPEGSKDLRDIFVKAETFQEFRDRRLDILRYSMLDVVYTLELFQKCYPEYIRMTNDKAILAGQTIISDAVLPHITYWDRWIYRCHKKYKEIIKELHDIIFPYLDEIHNAWLQGKYTPEGTQLENISWSYVLPFRHRKDKPLPDDWELRASWYEPFKKGEVKVKGRNIQYLLQFQYKYKGEWYDTYYVSKEGWNIKVDGDDIKLPNKTSPGESFGNLLSSDALDMIDCDEPLLRSKLVDHETLVKILKLIDLTTTYTGFYKRVEAQNKQNGLIAAEVKPCGTISGRTVSSLFNTLPAHYETPKIMSEIKSAMQCPKGWVFVGGDADQQESSVAAAMSDSFIGYSGTNEFSKAVLTGDKDQGTDFHSVMAKKVGIKRSTAKNVNYGLNK